MWGPGHPNRFLMQAWPRSAPSNLASIRPVRELTWHNARVETPRSYRHPERTRRNRVADAIYLLIGIAVFVAFAGYAVLLKRA